VNPRSGCRRSPRWRHRVLAPPGSFLQLGIDRNINRGGASPVPGAHRCKSISKCAFALTYNHYAPSMATVLKRCICVNTAAPSARSLSPRALAIVLTGNCDGFGDSDQFEGPCCSPGSCESSRFIPSLLFGAQKRGRQLVFSSFAGFRKAITEEFEMGFD